LMNRAAKRIPTFPFQAGKKTVWFRFLEGLIWCLMGTKWYSFLLI
jgi:hypothetical protein